MKLNKGYWELHSAKYVDFPCPTASLGIKQGKIVPFNQLTNPVLHGVLKVSRNGNWRLHIYWKQIKKDRGYLGIIPVLVHELTHLYDWIFTFKKDFDLWKKKDLELEERAQRIEKLTCKLMFMEYR